MNWGHKVTDTTKTFVAQKMMITLFVTRWFKNLYNQVKSDKPKTMDSAETVLQIREAYPRNI